MRGLIFVILLIAFGPILVLSDGAISKDFSLRSEKLEIANVQTTKRTCRSTIRLFHQCSYDYELNGEELSQDYKMFAFGAPKTVVLLSGTQTGQITSTVGQEYFWNRVLTMAFGLILSGLTLLLVIASMFSSKNRPQQHVPAQQVYAARPAHRAPAQRAVGTQSFGKRSGYHNS